MTTSFSVTWRIFRASVSSHTYSPMLLTSNERTKSTLKKEIVKKWHKVPGPNMLTILVLPFQLIIYSGSETCIKSFSHQRYHIMLEQNAFFPLCLFWNILLVYTYNIKRHSRWRIFTILSIHQLPKQIRWTWQCGWSVMSYTDFTWGNCHYMTCSFKGIALWVSIYLEFYLNKQFGYSKTSLHINSLVSLGSQSSL